MATTSERARDARVDSRVLSLVAPILRVIGYGPDTHFDDAHLQQVIDVAPLVRRALAPAGSDHLWGVQLRNTHLITEDQIITSFDPYALVVATVGNGWPSPDELARSDIWLIGPVGGSLASGAYLGAQLDILWPANRVAQIDVSGGLAQTLAVFNSTVSVAGLRDFLKTPDSQVQVPLCQRIPRGVTVRWVTQTAPAVADVFCYFSIGIFPQGLGQDAIGAS